MRVLTAAGGKGSGRYYGFRMQNPGFEEVRNTSGREFLGVYKALREESGYELPSVPSEGKARTAMEEWEASHPDNLITGRDSGQFFGFTNVGRGYLGDLTRFLFIPAVRDAADDVNEGRRSAITTLMDLVVRATLMNREEFVNLKEEIRTRYSKITDPTNLPELCLLSDGLTGTLSQYYPDKGVNIKWQKATEIELPLPRADVRIVEDGFQMPVTRMGHGLQRAFILTLLQHLAIASKPMESAEDELLQSEEAGTNGEGRSELCLIIGIEEPELYQHPSRQRHFAQILSDLAQRKIRGVASRTQIIYGTHSSLMVDVDRFNQVRRVPRKTTAGGLPKTSSVTETSWNELAKVLWEANGSPEQQYTGSTLKHRVAPFMTPWMNEGFFADMVVLVEGEDGRAAILGMAQLKNIDLEALGCTVIPCIGKQNMDRPAIIFSALGIPTWRSSPIQG